MDMRYFGTVIIGNHGYIFFKGFEEYFFATDYKCSLKQNIIRLTQVKCETIRRFAIALPTLMRRRDGYSTNEILKRLYDNMKPYFKLTIRREYFHTGCD